MSPDYIIEALSLSVGLLALWLVVYHMLIPTAVEWLRQRLFELRRELFLEMANGNVSCEDRAYQRLRVTINALLSFSERVTFARMMIAAVFLHRQSQEFTRALQQDIEQVQSRAGREALKRANERMTQIVFVHLLTTSPMMWLLFVVMFCAGAVYGAIRGLNGLRRTPERLASRLPLQAVEAEAIVQAGDALAAA